MTRPSSLAAWLALPPYQAYSYAYPHKSAYRTLDPAPSLASLWADEPRDALFLYLHVPFCTYRCGFCNLFAMARPAPAMVEAYVDQLAVQLRATARALGTHRFARFALGGGTPTYLDAGQLARVFEAVHAHATIDLASIPAGIEVSPETVDDTRLRVCREAGIDRVSMGIQSFSDAEVRSLVRPQQRATVERAIAAIRAHGFPTLNLDLIYGIEGQGVASFLASVDSALAFAPEELYLYPLYVRPRTGLARIGLRGRDTAVHTLRPEPLDDRAALYAAARERLLAAGYEQVSMRMFRAPHAPASGGPAYCCQDDGMVGIGCGARSYTRSLHYSSAYAVERGGVSAIVSDWLARDEASFAFAHHGFRLDAVEQRRRFVIQSLLVQPGLSLEAYHARFGSDAFDDLPQLHELAALGLGAVSDGVLALGEAGTARADTIGPWLGSEAVARAMQGIADAA